MAIANNRIVPGQCAEYNASSYFPERPNDIEYSIHKNASMIGYHFVTNNFIEFIFYFLNNQTNIINLTRWVKLFEIK